MTKSTFRLTGLLKLREATRDGCRLRLAEAFRAVALLQQELRRIEAELQQLQHCCRQAGGPGPVDINRLRQTQRFEVFLRTRAQDVRLEIQRAQQQAERCRLEVVEASREVQVLENLRARQAGRHLLAEHRLEIKQFDEFGVDRNRELSEK